MWRMGGGELHAADTWKKYIGAMWQHVDGGQNDSNFRMLMAEKQAVTALYNQRY